MNVEVLNAVVGQIEGASRKLNDAADAATRIIEALDARLVDADPGVSVWGELLASEKTTYHRDDTGPGEPAQRHVTLGFAKAKKKKWGLCVREEIKGRKGVILEEEITLLRKAERSVRLMALPHLEPLAETLLATLEAAAEQVKDLIAEAEPEEAAEAVPAAPLPAAPSAEPQPSPV